MWNMVSIKSYLPFCYTFDSLWAKIHHLCDCNFPFYPPNRSTKMGLIVFIYVSIFVYVRCFEILKLLNSAWNWVHA